MSKAQRLSTNERKVLTLMGACLVSLVVGGGLAAFRTDAPSAPALATSTNIADALPPGAHAAGTPQLPVGRPAIHPRSSAVPAYTLNDAIHYANAHPIPYVQILGAPLVVSRAEFMTSQDVSVLLDGESPGLPGDALVCFVELSGQITPLSVPPGSMPPTFSRGYEVFDAHTGNLLMWGGLP